jgi:hypothetical protein
VRNPDAEPVQCPQCGAKTAVNLRTGALYSHALPGKTKACTAGGSLVMECRDGQPPQIAEVEPAKPAPAPRQIVPDEHGESVRTVSGGLPGLGRRH